MLNKKLFFFFSLGMAAFTGATLLLFTYIYPQITELLPELFPELAGVLMQWGLISLQSILEIFLVDRSATLGMGPGESKGSSTEQPGVEVGKPLLMESDSDSIFRGLSPINELPSPGTRVGDGPTQTAAAPALNPAGFEAVGEPPIHPAPASHAPAPSNQQPSPSNVIVATPVSSNDEIWQSLVAGEGGANPQLPSGNPLPPMDPAQPELPAPEILGPPEMPPAFFIRDSSQLFLEMPSSPEEGGVGTPPPTNGSGNVGLDPQPATAGNFDPEEGAGKSTLGEAVAPEKADCPAGPSSSRQGKPTPDINQREQIKESAARLNRFLRKKAQEELEREGIRRRRTEF